MPIITIDQIIQVFVSANNMSKALFGVILNAVGENIATFFIQFWNSLMNGDIKSVLIFGFMLFSMIVFGYRLVRKKLYDSIMYLIDR